MGGALVVVVRGVVVVVRVVVSVVGRVVEVELVVPSQEHLMFA